MMEMYSVYAACIGIVAGLVHVVVERKDWNDTSVWVRAVVTGGVAAWLVSTTVPGQSEMALFLIGYFGDSVVGNITKSWHNSG